MLEESCFFIAIDGVWLLFDGVCNRRKHVHLRQEGSIRYFGIQIHMEATMIIVAERRLLYSQKGSDVRREFSIRIGMPYPVEEGMVNYPVGEGFAGCNVEIDGLDQEYSDVYGADSVQALNIATDLEPFLRPLQKKYDLFWASGDPYFED